MIITNRLSLPQPLVSMCESDYKAAPNEYRVTQLLKSTREVVLERRHSDKIEQDVSDMIWLLFGTAAHTVLENHDTGAGQVKETRISMNVGDCVLTGKPDLYDSNRQCVIDYKTASVWKIIYGSYDDWRRQLLTYAVMLDANGQPCTSGEIVAMLKDHSKRDAKFKPDYPRLPVHVQKFKFSEDDIAEGRLWVVQRIMQIQQMEGVPDDRLPLCSDEERYNSGTKYAVMAKGKKRALRVLDCYEDAYDWRTKNGGDSIEERKGEDKKCLDYCSVAPFCSYWQEHYSE